MSKIQPNATCPCGSGKKYKKCCRAPRLTAGTARPHTQLERSSALRKLESWLDDHAVADEDDAFDAFWGRFLDHEEELSTELSLMSEDAFDGWFAFDCEVKPGELWVDDLLASDELTAQERAFLQAMRATSMRLYEVIDVVPGVQVSLRDLLETDEVTVTERSASRQLVRDDCLAARVIARGSSGQPELELGVLSIPRLMKEAVVRQVKQARAQFVAEHPQAPISAFYKQLGPFFHEVWLSSIFEPPVAQLANTEGEALILTRVSFHVDDAPRLVHALASATAEGLEAHGDTSWQWFSTNHEVTLGTFTLNDGILTAETNSVERAARARELLERLGGTALRHRSTSHEDMRRKVMEAVTAHTLGRDVDDDDKASTALDPELAETLVVDHMNRYYHDWLDVPVPALDNLTPRAAAASSDPAYRGRVERLIRDLEAGYAHALKDGQPAYDPCWMRVELGLEDQMGTIKPLPLAHERIANGISGWADAMKGAADRLRARSDHSDRSSTVRTETLLTDLTLQRFLRGAADSQTGDRQTLAHVAHYAPALVNFELQRRKTFWVDEALAYMLEQTDPDVTGREVQLPFASCAFVFIDRHTLSSAERALARRREDPLRGQILRVVTAYVTEQTLERGRVLDVSVLCDALGADLPSLLHFSIPVHPEASVAAFLESLAPRPITTPPTPDSHPVRALLRTVLNATLYATSAGVSASEAQAHRSPRAPAALPDRQPSDAVYYLPGRIDIRNVRRLQELSRAPGGRTTLARFMVRGHWRRPAKNWAEQRMRWIEPYWKGPDIVAVIEKAYRLRA